GDVARQHDDGTLETALAQHLARLSAIHVGKTDVEQHQIEMVLLDDVDALCGGRRGDNIEFIVPRPLVLEGLTKFLVVIDDEKLARGTHPARLPSLSTLLETHTLASVRQGKQGLSRLARRKKVWSKRHGPREVCISAPSPAATRGVLRLGALHYPCALGRTGCRVRKREGDGATPIGRWVMHRVLYRADRVPRPRTLLPSVRIRTDAGWCDASSDRNYNRPVR